MNLDAVKQVKERYEGQLMSLDFVQGVGIRQADGEPSIAVYVDRADAKNKIPKTLDNVPVVVEQSGVFEAQ
ncbi:MAG: hypothetical protein JWO74_3445 [Solirubrobacterales bacterium]|nr:hypothetical protein [Solirubrobacterales bacterium]